MAHYFVIDKCKQRHSSGTGMACQHSFSLFVALKSGRVSHSMT